MGRAPCCSKVGLMRGPWSAKEDALLTEYIQQNGEGQWRSLPKKAGLLRCGKSCRLRWMNYLRPGIKRGNISEDEEDLIVRLHGLLGNRWSLIAGRLPGRTDNEIKNYWNTYLLKKLQTAGVNPNPNKTLPKPSKKSKKNNVTPDDPENPKKKKNTKSTGGQRDAADVTNAKVNDGVKNSTDDDSGVAKVKVYFPKPMRVMPRTESRSSLASGAASSSTNNSSGGGPVVAAAAEVTWKPVFELGENVADYYGGVRDDDEDDGFLGGGNNDGFALPSLNHQVDSVAMGVDDVSMFDALFDEYLQLLNFG